jgi:hypothetical protein
MSDHAMLEMTWSLAFPARFITIRTLETSEARRHRSATTHWRLSA